MSKLGIQMYTYDLTDDEFNCVLARNISCRSTCSILICMEAMLGLIFGFFYVYWWTIFIRYIFIQRTTTSINFEVLPCCHAFIVWSFQTTLYQFHVCLTPEMVNINLSNGAKKCFCQFRAFFPMQNKIQP